MQSLYTFAGGGRRKATLRWPWLAPGAASRCSHKDVRGTTGPERATCFLMVGAVAGVRSFGDARIKSSCADSASCLRVSLREFLAQVPCAS